MKSFQSEDAQRVGWRETLCRLISLLWILIGLLFESTNKLTSFTLMVRLYMFIVCYIQLFSLRVQITLKTHLVWFLVNILTIKWINNTEVMSMSSLYLNVLRCFVFLVHPQSCAQLLFWKDRRSVPSWAWWAGGAKRSLVSPSPGPGAAAECGCSSQLTLSPPLEYDEWIPMQIYEQRR